MKRALRWEKEVMGDGGEVGCVQGRWRLVSESWRIDVAHWDCVVVKMRGSLGVRQCGC